jgi:hypothetical protein
MAMLVLFCFCFKLQSTAVSHFCAGAQSEKEPVDRASEFSELHQVTSGAALLSVVQVVFVFFLSHSFSVTSKALAGVERLAQQLGASACAHMHAASPSQPGRVQQQHPLPAAASRRLVVAHVSQPACERPEAAALQPCFDGEVVAISHLLIPYCFFLRILRCLHSLRVLTVYDNPIGALPEALVSHAVQAGLVRCVHVSSQDAHNQIRPRHSLDRSRADTSCTQVIVALDFTTWFRIAQRHTKINLQSLMGGRTMQIKAW